MAFGRSCLQGRSFRKTNILWSQSIPHEPHRYGQDREVWTSRATWAPFLRDFKGSGFWGFCLFFSWFTSESICSYVNWGKNYLIGESFSFKVIFMWASGFGKNKNMLFRDLHYPARLLLGGDMNWKTVTLTGKRFFDCYFSVNTCFRIWFCVAQEIIFFQRQLLSLLQK